MDGINYNIKILIYKITNTAYEDSSQDKSKDKT